VTVRVISLVRGVAAPALHMGMPIDVDTGDPTVVRIQYFLLPPPNIASNAPPIPLNPVPAGRDPLLGFFRAPAINLPRAPGIYGFIAWRSTRSSNRSDALSQCRSRLPNVRHS